MKDKLNQFIDNLNGQFVEVSYKKAIYQCMDLAYAWIFCLDIPKSTIQHLYAYEVFTKANDFTREYFEIIPNKKDTIPQDGDLAIFKGGKAGHIAIALGGGTTSKFMRFEQNKPLGTSAHIQEGTYYNILGFLRPKSVTIGDIPGWFNTLSQQSSLSFEREGEFRAFWQKGTSYDQKVKELTAKVKVTNEMLSIKTSEVSTLTDKLEKLEGEYEESQKQFVDKGVEVREATWEAEKLAIQVKRLEEGIQSHEKETKELTVKLTACQDKAVEGLSRWELIKRIFRRGK